MNAAPMRRSAPAPVTTSLMSAPTRSQTAAISLTNEIFAARNALAVYLIISAVRTSVTMIGAPSGAYRSRSIGLGIRIVRRR